MFDAQAYLTTLEPPVYIDRAGKKHTGRVLGADQWLMFQHSLRASDNVDRILQRIVAHIFPHPWWKIWRHSVRWDIWQLPPIGRMRAVWNFMQSQAKAMGVSFPGTFPTLQPPLDSMAVPSPDSPTPGYSQSSISDTQGFTISGAPAGTPPMEPSPTVYS